MRMWVVVCGFREVGEASLGLGGCRSSCLVSSVIFLRDDGAVSQLRLPVSNSYSFGEMGGF